MAGSVNKVILVGNLGKDPEIRRLDNGVVLASFTLATSETYIDKSTGERRENTDWHNIVLWRGLAEIAEKYLKKGLKIYLEGKLKTRNYTDKEGQVRYITEVLVEDLVMLSRPDGESKNSTENKTIYPKPENQVLPQKMDNFLKDEEEDDLPF
ncbi:MAG: single-stranded DNA-binding protein [Flavobacteriia bacterium]|nr:single-stranded DNA-binding protein [Flavobacteriia bacterium]